ncbi:MAG TPA: PAS domain-containing sensor histidine kinase, partial [Clostridia bacterium]|nr:PAS domain-containing sensor histidine kinase [Clostridia bacterium]
MQQGTQRDTGAGLAAPAIAGMVVVIGCLTLCGWIFGIPTLKSVFPGLVSMKVNTALCFILAGLSLGLQSRPPPDPAALRRRLGQVLALVVFCMGFLVLCEWTFGWDLGIDQLVFRDVREPIALSAPGRMAHATAINFCLLGLALFFLDAETRRNRWPAQYLTLTVIGITLVAFMGYFYDIGNLSQVAPYASVALHTVIGFLLLSAGILLARPRRGAMVLVMGATPGGIMVRRMLLPGIFVTILFGGLAVLLQRAGHYGFGFGIALLVTALIALLAGLIWWAARAL